jgi:hypothetical protein
MGRRGWAVALVVLSGVACSSGNSDAPSQEAGLGPLDGGGAVVVASDDASSDTSSDSPSVTTQTVGAAGGAVSAAGVALTIPAGALGGDTEITVTTIGTQVSGYVALSPIFSFGPAGTTLLKPATIAITLTTPAADATIFWSNAAGGYDALSTTVSADSASASIGRLGDGFAGTVQPGRDASASGEAGPAEGGAIADAASAADGAIADAASADASSDGGAFGISATVDGTLTAFPYNVRATLLQAWWRIAGDDSPSPTHWTMQLVVPTNAGTLMCSGGIYPAITYTHYSAVAGDAGAADATYTTTSSMGASCTIDETTTATTQGQHAQGTFSGTLVLSGDAGGPASHTLASGSYDAVVP